MANETALNWTKTVIEGITKQTASTEAMTITIVKQKSKWVTEYRFNTKRLKPFNSNHKSKINAMGCAFNFSTSFMGSDIWKNAESI